MNRLIINFYLTYKCNLSCDYCSVYNNGFLLENNKELFLSNGFSDFINKFNKDIISIEFFGGEPLLEKKFIKDFYKYYDNFFQYTITTNGILFDKQLDFFDRISVSVHYNIIEDLLLKIKKGEFDNLKSSIYFTFVLDKYNIDLYYDFANILYNNGFLNINILPVFNKYNWGNEDIRNLDLLVKYLKEKSFNLSFLGYENNKKDFEFSTDISGDLYGFTGEYIFHPKLKNTFYIGNIFTDKHDDIIKKLNIKFVYLNKLSYRQNALLRKAFSGNQTIENFEFMNKLLMYYNRK